MVGQCLPSGAGHIILCSRGRPVPPSEYPFTCWSSPVLLSDTEGQWSSDALTNVPTPEAWKVGDVFLLRRNNICIIGNNC